MNPPQVQPPSPAGASRVLFLNDLGFQYGAGVAHARQIQSFILAGWEVGAMAWEPGGIEFATITTRQPDPDLWLGMRHIRHLERSPARSDDAVIAGILCEVARFSPHVVILGNLHAAGWPLQLLPGLQQLGCRVVAYLHDGYLFSGRCAYPGSCRLYLSGCNETCPTPGEYPPLEPRLIAGQWALRRQIFNVPNGVEVVANSNWMRDVFRAALPHCRSCECVHLAADAAVFKPGDKPAARQRWGLPTDRPVVLCAAVNFRDHRKGGHYLQEIVAALGDSVTFAAFGHHADEIPNLIGLGYHIEAAALASIYHCADVFLGTAVEEAFGQTVMEAQLCGVPVVAFQAGGVVEIIRHEITGRLVPNGDVDAAVTAIRSLLDNPALRQSFSDCARTTAVSRFSLEAQACRWTTYLATPPAHITHPELGKADSPWPAGKSRDFSLPPNLPDLIRSLPGPLATEDTAKLYEAGFHSGEVILEINLSAGRSACLGLWGALANRKRTTAPQYYGLSVAEEPLARTRKTLIEHGLADYCHLFHGTLREFLSRWEIAPTLVLLSGGLATKAVTHALDDLSKVLRPGVPVILLDQPVGANLLGASGARNTAIELVATGKARLLDCSDDTAVIVTSVHG